MSVAKTIQLRFKLPAASVNTPVSQSLLINRTGSNNDSFQFGLFLEYTGSLSSGSYSGSIVDPYYQYGTLKFISGSVSASTYLPFFDGGWWSVMVTQEGSGPYTYTLYTKNKLYSGDDGNTIGFQASSSFTDSGSWSIPGTIQIPGSGSATIAGGIYLPATASFQEVRYYTTTLSESVFNDYVMNANSFEGNTSAYNELFFRAPLGGELYTGSTSVHPSVTGSSPTASFIDGTSTFSYSGSYNFVSNTEVNFYDQGVVGIKNRVSNKIKQSNIILPATSSGLPTTDVLSSYIRVQQDLPISQSYTNNLNLAEIAFSPQNEINEDINNQLGYFNIGNYLDIRSTSSQYPELNKLRENYFKKYQSNYDYKDYTRLIKYFDNALFKMIKDYVPARTSISTGIVIKQHILERSKHPEPVLTYTQPEYTSSIDMYTITGSEGGVFENQEVTQSWSGSYITPSGSVPYIQNTEEEFYNGELSGSKIDIPQPHPCPVDFVGVYYTGSFEVNRDVLDPSNTWFKPNYDFDYDKSYTLQFTINNHPDAAGNGAVNILNGDKNNYVYGSPYLAPGSSLDVILEIKDVVSPLYFLDAAQVFINSPSMSITDFTASVYQLEDSDCAPLINNTSTYPQSQYYMKVDYNSGQLVPTNFDSLIDGTGTKANVQDYYYTLRRQINPRYDGSRLTAYQINAFTASTDISYGKNPVIEKYSNYFIYFDWIGGSNPQYPGGGNVHGIYLIDIEGNAIPLTTDNLNLGRVENIFKQGTTANIIPAVYSAGNESIKVDIVDGGALYQTILQRSGSATAYLTYQDGSGNSLVSIVPDAFFNTGSSKSELADNISGSGFLESSLGFFYPLLSGELAPGGEKLVGNGSLKIFNKNTGQISNNPVAYEDTLLPLQYGDFIRFGNTGSAENTGSLDGRFEGFQTVRIISSSYTTFNNSGSIFLNNEVDDVIIDKLLGGNNNNQNYRIFRRVPNESFVLIKNIPEYVDPGFLIPEDFNPNYDPYDLAKKAGVIS